MKNSFKLNLIFVFVILVLGFLVYANSLFGQFIWDDHDLIVNNPYIKNLKHVGRFFFNDMGSGSGARFNYYRPLAMVVHALEYQLWGLNVFGYHLTNIIVHLLIALACFYLIYILFDNRLLAFLTAIFFTIHPAQVETVASISDLGNALPVLFMLISFIFYIRNQCFNRRGDYFIMLGAFILALLSKENALILPLLFLLYHFVFKKEFKSKAYLPVLAVTFLYILVRNSVLMASVLHSVSIFKRIPGFFVALTNYFQLLIFPFDLHMEYGNHLYNFSNPLAILGILIFLGLIAVVFKSKNKLIAFSAGWFLIAILPFSNVFFKMAFYMAEHYVYLSSISFFLIIAAVLNRAAENQKLKAFIFILAACLAGFYSYLTVKQNVYWQDEITFYQRTLKYAPKSPAINTNLGAVYYSLGRIAEAEKLYQTAIELDPYYAPAYYNLALLYADFGQDALAEKAYKKTIKNDPNYSRAYNNLGGLYSRLGRKLEAIVMLSKAIEISPYLTQSYNNLIVIYWQMSRRDLAQIYFNKAYNLQVEIYPQVLQLIKNQRQD